MSEEQLAPMKPQVYKDERPKEYFDRFHERARKREPDPMYEIVRAIVTAMAYGFFRMRAMAAEQVPASGPVILAPNHFSFFDHFFLAAALRRKVRFMAKSQLFKRPMQFVYTHGGVFPVRRGHRDDDAFITAELILRRGGAVAMYCEGGRSRTGTLSEHAKPGIGRLALESGAPIVPVAIYGSAKVRNWKKLQFPKVTVLYGTPFRFETVAAPTREQSQAAADEIFDEIKALYAQLEQLGRKGVKAAVREQRRSRRGRAATAQ
ncbi:MAG: 1-acyl-sn-glycerol-3-phosphate acyltransferase [Solirubrobacteraceae bacterium]|jgi:1-acyl-sn-glycerol-3-phosphate acyltransferase|nr:1-acyl-sn-glycerol-3-phosphate acyltransferase [Solirubrobacteraceae bacterium]